MISIPLKSPENHKFWMMTLDDDDDYDNDDDDDDDDDDEVN